MAAAVGLLLFSRPQPELQHCAAAHLNVEETCAVAAKASKAQAAAAAAAGDSSRAAG